MANSNDIERMQQLINYGRNVNKTSVSGKPVLEHSVKAADGNTYGILHECNKYYVMVAPVKNSAVVAEDFKHIGGLNNRRNNEYSSYSVAMENLDLKVRSVNESVRAKTGVKVPTSTILKEEKDWQSSVTQETRNQIERFKQIMENVNLIENKYVPSAHTLPEAPAKNPSDEQVHTPFTDTAVAKGDKEFTKTETNPATAGGPFETTAKAEMQSDKKPSGNGEDTYNQDAKYVPDGSVANQKPTGGKVTRADESKKRTIKVTEQQIKENAAEVLAWNRKKEDYIDTSKGTEIGDTAPFVDKPENKIQEEEGVAVHNTDDQNKPTPGTSEVGDTAPFDNKVNESGIDPAQVAGMPEGVGEEDEIELDDTFDTDYENWLNNDEAGDFLNDDLSIDAEVDTQSGPFGESKRKPCRESKKIENKRILGESTENGDWHGVPGARFIWHGEWADPEIEYEGHLINYWDFANFFETDEEEDNASPEEVKAILDDILFGMSESDDMKESKKMNEGAVDLGYGKHPAFQKAPMTTPPAKEVAKNGYRDWNDDSAKSEKPFATTMGDIAPYKEEIVKALTDGIMRKLNFQGKA